MLQTYRHQTSDIQTYRPSDEAGPRGAFAPKKFMILAVMSVKKANILKERLPLENLSKGSVDEILYMFNQDFFLQSFKLFSVIFF